jgi:hypothetical protein
MKPRLRVKCDISISDEKDVFWQCTVIYSDFWNKPDFSSFVDIRQGFLLPKGRINEHETQKKDENNKMSKVFHTTLPLFIQYSNKNIP